MSSFPRFADFLLAFLFGIIIPFLSGIRSAEAFRQMPQELDQSSKNRFYLGNSFFLILLALIVLFVWWLYDRPLSSLGFRPARTHAWGLPWWLAGIFIALYLSDIWMQLKKDPAEREAEAAETPTPFMPTRWSDLPVYALMCASAGAGEEIVYRGFLLSFFQALFAEWSGAALLTVLVPALLFSAAHLYQGAGTVFKILVLSTIFGMIFWYSGSIYLLMILHAGLDLASGIISIYLSRKEGE